MCQVIRKQGVGAEVSHATVVSYEHEMLMWKNEVLWFEPPEALLCAVFVTVGMYFSLRGGQEHYDLKVDQFNHTVLVYYYSIILLFNIQYWSYCTPTTIQEMKVCASPLIHPRKSQ